MLTSVNGTSVHNIAAVSTSTGVVNTAFGHNANGQVSTLLTQGSHVLTGGYFTTINGSSANPYFASLDTTTGTDDGWAGVDTFHQRGKRALPSVQLGSSRNNSSDG